MADPILQLEDRAKKLHSTWRPAGSSFWHELSRTERDRWVKLAREMEARDKRLQEAEGLVRDLAEAEFKRPCSFDHHGYCQEHGWFETDPPCPIPRAKALLE